MFLNDNLCFKELKNSHVINYITEKCHIKYYIFVKVCKIFCNASIFTHNFFEVLNSILQMFTDV